MRHNREPLLIRNSCKEFFWLGLLALMLLDGGPARANPVLIPSGSYLPFFVSKPRVGQVSVSPTSPLPISVSSFLMDPHPITNGDYLKFVKAHAEWRRSHVPRIFADASYLKHWRSDLALAQPGDLSRPVTHISWFAALAYCEARQATLPTTDQWEYAAADAGRNSSHISAEILEWYAHPSTRVPAPIRLHTPNGYGLYDLFGLVWEWTLDFNSSMPSAESRSDGTKDSALFCGAGSLAASDPSDYARFMRFSFRSSLKADYTTINLGFRCAQERVRP